MIAHIYISFQNHWGQASPTGHGEIVYLNLLIYSTNIYVFIIKVMYFFQIMNIIVSFGNHEEKIPKYRREQICLSFQSPMMKYC